MAARIHVRPNLPYDALSKHNDNRYQLLSARGVPPSSEMLDADSNYVIDSLDQLSEDIEGVIAGNIPGYDDIENRFKFLTTDAENVSWAFVREFNIGDQEVTNRIIRDGAVTEDKLDDGAITESKIATNSITEEKIANDSITTTKISDNSITNIKIVDATITTVKLSDESVTTEKIEDSSITTDKLVNSSVTTDKIEDGSITLSKLAAEVLSFILPIGTIHKYGGTAAPEGFLLCNGAAVSRATYAALFAVIGTSFGSGDGNTTFNIPDFRGRVGAGFVGSAAGRITEATNLAIGGSGGQEKKTLTTQNLPSFSLSYNKSIAGLTTLGGSGGLTIPRVLVDSPEQTSSIGNNSPLNTMDPFLFVNYIIKY